MAFFASFDSFVVLRVAGDALEGGMFCILKPQHFIRLGVTESAYGVIRIVRITDL